MKSILFIYFPFLLAVFNGLAQINNFADSDSFKETLKEDSCTFSSTGRNMFFILEPGYQLVLEGREQRRNCKTAYNGFE